MKLKTTQNHESLKEVTEKALHQIDEKKYVTEMQLKGIKQSLKIGIGFRGKDFVLCSSWQDE